MATKPKPEVMCTRNGYPEGQYSGRIVAAKHVVLPDGLGLGPNRNWNVIQWAYHADGQELATRLNLPLPTKQECLLRALGILDAFVNSLVSSQKISLYLTRNRGGNGVYVGTPPAREDS